MTRTFVKLALVVSSAVCATEFAVLALAVDQGGGVSERVKKLTRAVKWTQVAAVPINFNTYHPQGMVKIGDTYFVSTVDIRKPTTRYPQLQDGYDRDTGEGVGHLIKFDAKGNVITDLTLGEGSVCTTPEAWITTANGSGCPWRNTVRTVARSSTASIPRR